MGDGALHLGRRGPAHPRRLRERPGQAEHRGPESREPALNAAGVALAALLVGLPLATAVQEIALAICLGAALIGARRGAWLALPWGIPALACAVAWTLGGAASGDVREGLGHAWLLAPLVAVPALVSRARGPLVEVGLWAAAAAAAWSVVQAVDGAEGHGGFSHHLTLAYALLPPLGVAVARGAWARAGLLVAGILATGSEGALVATATTIAAAWGGRPGWALLGGVGGTLALLVVAADPGELHQRAILWTGGLTVAAAGPVGAGAYATASAPVYDAIEAGFWFPNHAHDSGIQLLAVLGPGALAVHAWLCTRALRHGDAGAAAGLAGVLVGALTQDVLGDLEVARAAWTWLALTGNLGRATVTDKPPP